MACDIGAYEYGEGADLAITKARVGAGPVAPGWAIGYAITVTNAGPVAPITATVVDSWSPITAVVAVEAPGCSVDLTGGTLTCVVAGIGLGPAATGLPHVVLTTSAAFVGTLTNAAVVTSTDGIIDGDPADNTCTPVVVTIVNLQDVFLPHISRAL